MECKEIRVEKWRVDELVGDDFRGEGEQWREGVVELLAEEEELFSAGECDDEADCEAPEGAVGGICVRAERLGREVADVVYYGRWFELNEVGPAALGVGVPVEWC